MDRSKLVAVITGVISLLLAVGYLVLVQILDFRGDMVPAPLSTLIGVVEPALELIT
ncbi:glucose-inhibited division protein A [Nodosilinea sp. FACHB-141]|nr:glucose-inhibited division protein A [Nodosilinea sp. FACHB-13]MBD2111681.1 glucose-inhibited division protein A [Nodosilinea sp. FACHB-141]